ncbi:MAG: DUF3224 domain-containing protein [Planctomycetes bacterium]|nr:DUF3224 domain-containing protein [Planctomycetota bacterium]
MKQRVNTRFRGASWNETELAAAAGAPKMTRASVENVYEGDIAGRGALEYLMAYNQAGNAAFVGLERITGSVLGRAGSFVLEHRGTYGQDGVRIELVVLPGAGSGELAGLLGRGTFASGHAELYDLALDLELPD